MWITRIACYRDGRLQKLDVDLGRITTSEDWIQLSEGEEVEDGGDILPTSLVEPTSGRWKRKSLIEGRTEGKGNAMQDYRLTLHGKGEMGCRSKHTLRGDHRGDCRDTSVKGCWTRMPRRALADVSKSKFF